MFKDLKLKLPVGSGHLVVDCNAYTYERVVDLNEKVTEIRRKHSLFTRYPLEPEESRENWKKRVEPLLEGELVRKPGEDVDVHLGRLFSTPVDTHKMALELLNAIADVFQLKKVSEDDFKQTNWLYARAFIYDVLTLGDIEASDFAPRKPGGA